MDEIVEDELQHEGEQEEEEEEDELQHEAEQEEEEEDEQEQQHDENPGYYNLLHEMSEKWMSTQSNHKVSATATDAFWNIALKYWPKIVSAKKNEGITKKTPMFQNQRKKLHKSMSPVVEMEYGFLNVNDGTIEKVQSRTAPKRPHGDYIKLYEEAHINVSTTISPSVRLLVRPSVRLILCVNIDMSVRLSV